MRRLVHVLAASALLGGLLAGCGGSDSGRSGGSANGAGHSSNRGKDATAATLVKSGFGQDGEYVWATSLVHNDSGVVGQTVTVHFDLKDASGNLVKSADQVEAFSRPNEDLVVGNQVDVPRRTKITTVKASLNVEDEGAFSDKPFPEMPTSKPVLKKVYGAWQAHFELTNPTSKPVKNPRIGIVCFDARKRIVGGTSEFPELVPPKGKVAVDTVGLTVSGKPHACKAYVGAPM